MSLFFYLLRALVFASLLLLGACPVLIIGALLRFTLRRWPLQPMLWYEGALLRLLGLEDA